MLSLCAVLICMHLAAADTPTAPANEVHTDRTSMLASWVTQITASIRREWLMPPNVQPGIVCALQVTQTPEGKVMNVSIRQCNGDKSLRESIVAAVFKASPLPPPPDPSLFVPDLVITFRPN